MAIQEAELSVVGAQLQEQVVLQGKTYQEYILAVEQHPYLQIEYLEGTIVMSPSPVPLHQDICRNLFRLLDGYVYARRLGRIYWAPLDVELVPETQIAQPDLIFITQERVAQLVGEKRITGAPDLVIEVLSPGTARIDRFVKLVLYARSGVAEYWIVDQQEQAVIVPVLDKGTYRVAGIFLSGDTITAGRFAEAQIGVDQIFEI